MRLVAELDAKTFVFENVKGLTVGKHREFLDELISAFDRSGYSVRLPWKVLDAAHFGVPQHRQRLILFGAKKGTPLPDYPEQIVNPADDLHPRPRLPLGPTCKDALCDLPDAERFDALLANDSVWTALSGKTSAYAKALRCQTSDAWHFGHPRSWDPGMLTSSARTTHTNISRRRFAETAPGHAEPISRFFKLRPDGLSNTLRAGTDGCAALLQARAPSTTSTTDASPFGKWPAFMASPTGSASTRPNGTARGR